jgi:hypothetical protein
MQRSLPTHGKWNPLLIICIFIPAIALAYMAIILNSAHIQNSQAPDFDKESSLFSENAFYYSYYKRFQSAEPLSTVFHSLAADDEFTYPVKTVSFFSFNLWPEIFIGSLYRMIGKGSAFNFYVFFAGLATMSIFLVPLAFTLVEKRPWFVLLFSYLILLSNIGFISRFQFAPILREIFAFPFFFVFMMALFSYVRSGKKQQLWIAALSTFFCGIFWQFSVLSFLLINAILLAFWFFTKAELKQRCEKLLLSQYYVWILLCICLGLNDFYLFSWNFSLLFCFYLAKKFKKNSIWFLFPVLPLLFGYSFGHIISLVKSFFGIENFDSVLYSSIQAFRPLQAEQYKFFILNGTLLMILATLAQFKKLPREIKFMAVFPIAFTVPAMLVLRLTPLAVFSWVTYIFCCLQYFNKTALTILLLTMTGLLGYKNEIKYVSQELFVQPFQTDLVLYAQSNIPPGAVIATDFPVSSALALNTQLKFILHPQYESYESRRRNQIFSRVYAYYSPDSIETYMKEFHPDYLILDMRRCETNPFSEKIVNTLHAEHPRESTRKFCEIDFSQKGMPFSLVEKIGFYSILKRSKKT